MGIFEINIIPCERIRGIFITDDKNIDLEIMKWF